MRIPLFLFLAFGLNLGFCLGQGLKWEWYQFHPYYNNGVLTSSGEALSAACLDSLIAVSISEDTARGSRTNIYWLKTIKILNYRGQEVNSFTVPSYWAYGEVMCKLTDSSFVIFSSYQDTRQGGPLYALNAKAYSISGRLLWGKTLGVDGWPGGTTDIYPVAGGGLDIVYGWYDSSNTHHLTYARIDPLGNFKSGPQEISSFISQNNGWGIKLRPNRLGFVTWNKQRVSGHYMLNVYRTDAALTQTTTQTIPYGSDTAYGQDWVYPMGDDGYLFMGTPYNLRSPPPDNRLFTYLARYDANGNKIWGGRAYHKRIALQALADGGMLMFTEEDTLFDSRGNVISGAIKNTFSRIRADSSIFWINDYSDLENVGAYYSSISYDGSNGAIRYGGKGVSGLGGGPWVGYFFNFGNPIDPTNVRGPRARPSVLEALLYPNPAQDKIYLKSDKTLSYKLVSITGAAIKEGALQPNEALDVSSLPKGIYQLLVIEGTQKVVKRFVKN